MGRNSLQKPTYVTKPQFICRNKRLNKKNEKKFEKSIVRFIKVYLCQAFTNFLLIIFL